MIVHTIEGKEIVPVIGNLRVSEAIETMITFRDSLINPPLIELAEIICNSELS